MINPSKGYVMEIQYPREGSVPKILKALVWTTRRRSRDVY